MPLLLNYVVADLSGLNRRFRKLIQAKEHVSMDELHRALREEGISSVD